MRPKRCVAVIASAPPDPSARCRAAVQRRQRFDICDTCASIASISREGDVDRPATSGGTGRLLEAVLEVHEDGVAQRRRVGRDVGDCHHEGGVLQQDAGGTAVRMVVERPWTDEVGLPRRMSLMICSRLWSVGINSPSWVIERDIVDPSRRSGSCASRPALAASVPPPWLWWLGRRWSTTEADAMTGGCRLRGCSARRTSEPLRDALEGDDVERDGGPATGEGQAPAPEPGSSIRHRRGETRE